MRRFLLAVFFAALPVPGWADISVVTAVPGTGDTTTSVAMTIPTVANGDVLIVNAVSTNSTATLTISDDSGVGSWTTKDNTNNSMTGAIFWKRITNSGSEGGATATAASGTNCMAAVMVVYRGVVASGDPFEAFSTESNASGDESHAEITSLTNGSWIMLGNSSGNNINISAQACTDPSSLAEQAEHQSAGGADCTAAHASAVKASAGATGACTWSQINNVSVTWLGAIKPEAGAPPSTPSRLMLMGVGP